MCMRLLDCPQFGLVHQSAAPAPAPIGAGAHPVHWVYYRKKLYLYIHQFSSKFTSTSNLYGSPDMPLTISELPAPIHPFACPCASSHSPALDHIHLLTCPCSCAFSHLHFCWRLRLLLPLLLSSCS